MQSSFYEGGGHANVAMLRVRGADVKESFGKESIENHRTTKSTHAATTSLAASLFLQFLPWRHAESPPCNGSAEWNLFLTKATQQNNP